MPLCSTFCPLSRTVPACLTCLSLSHLKSTCKQPPPPPLPALNSSHPPVSPHYFSSWQQFRKSCLLSLHSFPCFLLYLLWPGHLGSAPPKHPEVTTLSKSPSSVDTAQAQGTHAPSAAHNTVGYTLLLEALPHLRVFCLAVLFPPPDLASCACGRHSSALGPGPSSSVSHSRPGQSWPHPRRC